MLLGLLLLASAALIAWCAVGSVGSTSRRRELRRRERYLHHHPGRASWLDVERLLAADLPPARVADVCRRAESQGISPAVLWTLVDRYGTDLIALAVTPESSYRPPHPRNPARFAPWSPIAGRGHWPHSVN
jgi:hypothetical protein